MRLEMMGAALIVENKKRTLVLADLHLGIEDELRQRGINIGSQTDKVLKRVVTCVRAAEPDAIVLLGDIKHAVPGVSYQDRTEVPHFLASLLFLFPYPLILHTYRYAIIIWYEIVICDETGDEGSGADSRE